MIESQDALGYENSYGTTYAYDQANRLLETLDPEGALDSLPYTVQYTYDALGRILTQTDANGYVTENTYDDNGNVLTITVDRRPDPDKHIRPAGKSA